MGCLFGFKYLSNYGLSIKQDGEPFFWKNSPSHTLRTVVLSMRQATVIVADPPRPGYKESSFIESGYSLIYPCGYIFPYP